MYNTFNSQMPRKTEILWAAGRSGVESFPMFPNTEAAIFDSTAPIVWQVRTDSIGNKTLSPFDISPHEEKSPLSDLEERLARLEEKLNESVHESKTDA